MGDTDRLAALLDAALIGMVRTSYPMPRNAEEKGWNEALHAAREKVRAALETTMPDLNTLRSEVRLLADWTPEQWAEVRGGDPIARTLNAVLDLIDFLPLSPDRQGVTLDPRPAPDLGPLVADGCPACHHPDHDPGSCHWCPRCELHTDDAYAWVQRFEPELIRPAPGTALQQAALSLALAAEWDDDFDGQYVDWLVPDAAMSRLRVALGIEPPSSKP